MTGQWHPESDYSWVELAWWKEPDGYYAMTTDADGNEQDHGPLTVNAVNWLADYARHNGYTAEETTGPENDVAVRVVEFTVKRGA